MSGVGRLSTAQREAIHSRLDDALTVFAFLVLPSILLDDWADDQTMRAVAVGFDWAVWLGFTFSLIGIAVVAINRRQVLRVHALDVLLVLLTPPFVPNAWQAFRLLRSLRLLRLFLAGTRLHRHARRLTHTNVVGPAAVLLALIIVTAATFVSIVEPDHVPTIGIGLWWAASRVAAMGDGGVTLTAPAARLAEIALAVCGLAFLSLITAAIATVFIRSKQNTADVDHRLDEILRRLERIEKKSTE